MKNNEEPVKSLNSLKPTSDTMHPSWFTQRLLGYYKHKAAKLEKEYNGLLEMVENVKSICDTSNELRSELNLRNEEVSKLQQLVGDLQIHLFYQRENNLKLTSENDQLKIQDYENKKKINLLLMVNGTTEKKYCHFITANIQGNFVTPQLPPKLKKMKEQKQKQLTKRIIQSLENEQDSQAQLLTNQVLSSQLEHQKKISKQHIEMLLKEKELMSQERKIEIGRLQQDVNFLCSKLKESQELMCQMAEKLIKSKCTHERDKTAWIEEKDKYLKTMERMRVRLGDEYTLSTPGSGNGKGRVCSENSIMREKILEKEKLATEYQQKALVLQQEVSQLQERAYICKRIFKEKTEKMATHVAYLKSKYEDLDRRRQLEAEGFHTDIRMLRERLKELEKKIDKAPGRLQANEQKELLVSARNTLNRAKQLESELSYMKSKIYALKCHTEILT
ncbi:hypothetical protein RUM44_014039 [Polyplax serrata]|uniref:Coiled-coil domain-containing protein 77 n=1 Tax=Polyplax serrata TaxID=468196 RepID=A0ABR1BFW4_POLSC